MVSSNLGEWLPVHCQSTVGLTLMTGCRHYNSGHKPPLWESDTLVHLFLLNTFHRQFVVFKFSSISLLVSLLWPSYIIFTVSPWPPGLLLDTSCAHCCCRAAGHRTVEMVPVPVSLSSLWARVSILCPLSSVVTAGPGLRPDTDSGLISNSERGRGEFWAHAHHLSPLKQHQTSNLTSSENINYFGFMALSRNSLSWKCCLHVVYFCSKTVLPRDRDTLSWFKMFCPKKRR